MLSIVGITGVEVSSHGKNYPLKKGIIIKIIVIINGCITNSTLS